MGWRIYNVEEQRKLFIKEYQRGDKTFTDICEIFAISRPTGYITLPADLPVKTIYLDIPEENKICKETGKALVKIGV